MGGQFFDGSGDNTVSTVNSTTANLAAAATFTGTGEEVINYGNITVSVFTSHTGTLTVQWSDDNTTWRADGDSYAVTATTLKTISYGPAYRYFRVVYTNGGTLTTTLVLQTIYRVGHTKPSSHRAAAALSADTDAEVSKAVVAGQLADNSFTNIRASANSDLGVVDTLMSGGSQGALTVGTSAVLAAVSGTNLANRKSLTVYNNGAVLIYWGFTNAVTTSTGTPIVPGQLAIFGVRDSTNIYLISGTASQNTRLTESP